MTVILLWTQSDPGWGTDQVRIKKSNPVFAKSW